MSDLSDFRRKVYEPETEALHKRIAILRARVAELEAWAGEVISEIEDNHDFRADLLARGRELLKGGE